MIIKQEYEVLSLQDLCFLEQFIRAVFMRIRERIGQMLERKEIEAEIKIQIKRNNSHDCVSLKFAGTDSFSETIAVGNDQYVCDIVKARLDMLVYFPPIQKIVLDVSSNLDRDDDDTFYIIIVIKQKND